MQVGTIEGFSGAILKHLREERHSLVTGLASGAAADYNQYKITIGRIQSLDSLEAKIRQLIHHHFGDDDAYE